MGNDMERQRSRERGRERGRERSRERERERERHTHTHTQTNQSKQTNKQNNQTTALCALPYYCLQKLNNPYARGKVPAGTMPHPSMRFETEVDSQPYAKDEVVKNPHMAANPHARGRIQVCDLRWNVQNPVWSPTSLAFSLALTSIHTASLLPHTAPAPGFSCRAAQCRTQVRGLRAATKGLTQTRAPRMKPPSRTHTLVGE